MRNLVARSRNPLLLGILICCVMLAGGVALAVPSHHTSHIKGTRIKVHSMPGNRLKNNSVTGKQIRENSLRTVPRAKAAGVATKVAGYQVIPYRHVAAFNVSDFSGTYPASTETDVFTRGPVTVYLRCLHNTTEDATVAWFFLKTSQNGVLMFGDETPMGGAVIDTTVAENSRFVAASQADANKHVYAAESETVTTASGQSFVIRLQFGVKDGTPPTTSPAYGSGNGCFYQAEIEG